MRKRLIMLPFLASLAGCGDPLTGVERISEIEDIPTDGAATALPTEAELDRDTPIFASLFRRSPPAEETIDVPVTDTGEDGPGDVPEVTEDIAAAVGEVPEPDGIAAAVADTGPPEPKRPSGVFGWLRSKVGPPAGAPTGAVVAPVALVRETDIADLAEDRGASQTTATPPAAPQQMGLGALLAPRTAAPLEIDLQDVPLGTVVPFGQIARVCDARGQKMGKLVQQAARKGANYKLYDTEPDSAAPRTFYVTGFIDNCPRQFTAALAMFGTPEMHEQLRYGLPASEYPYSTTDKAYEKVKSQVCKVGRSKPCGTRVSRLTQTTAFVSAYEKFAENARWADMLLHEGAVLAAALKTP
jgi:hypothetical protein